jgi:hypothetical protein
MIGMQILNDFLLNLRKEPSSVAFRVSQIRQTEYASIAQVMGEKKMRVN